MKTSTNPATSSAGANHPNTGTSASLYAPTTASRTGAGSSCTACGVKLC